MSQVVVVAVTGAVDSLVCALLPLQLAVVAREVGHDLLAMGRGECE